MNPIKQIIRRLARRVGYDIIVFDSGFARARTMEWLSSLTIRTVLDIGANAGQFAEKVRALLPEATIHSFEPLPEPYAALSRKSATIGNIHPHPFALGSTNARLTMNQNAFTPASSLLPMADLHSQTYPYTAKASPIEIEVRVLDEVAPSLSLQAPLLAKLDVQGYEAEVIRGGPKTLGQAAMAIVETSYEPLYEGGATFDEVYSLLRNLGFRYAGDVDRMYHPSTGRVLQADSLFVRDDGQRVATKL